MDAPTSDPAHSPTTAELLHETLQPDAQTELLLEQGTRLVRRIVLVGQKSRNGYEYAERALREATSLYVGKPVFLDHTHPGQQPHQRDEKDLVGHIEHAHFDAGKIWADIRVRETAAGNVFLTLVEHLLPEIGMSHVVRAVRSPDGHSVERILEVVSVDVVRFPATTRTLRESTSRESTSLQSTLVHEHSTCPVSHELLREVCVPDDRDGVLSQAEWSMLEEMTRLKQTAEHWKTRAERLERAAAHHAEVERLLEQSRLPAVALTPQFRRMLLEARDEHVRQELIQERQDLIRQLRVVPPSSAGRLAPSSAHEDEAIIRAIRHRR